MTLPFMRRFLGLCLAGVCLLFTPLNGATASSPSPAPGKPATTQSKTVLSPGIQLAQTLSTVTGIAISPLLGVGVVGCWQYFKAPSGQRAGLPWYAQPWFWLPALLIVGLMATKDVVGAALPPGLKKPIDFVEAIENKLSGLIATGALIPMMGTLLSAAGMQVNGALAGTGLAFIDGTALLQLAATPFALVAYGLVWMASHAIHVLILLSPWGAVDAALKALRTALLSALAAISTLNPWWGACFSVVLIIVSYYLAGWSFRLTVQGWVFCWDFFSLRRTRFQPGTSVNWAFAARRIGQAPIRTYGRLAQTQSGDLEFRYRPWLVLPEKSELLGQPSSLTIGKALLHPTLERERPEGALTLLNFPPRYRTHEVALAQSHGLQIVEIGVLGGLKWIGRAIKELLGLAPASAA